MDMTAVKPGQVVALEPGLQMLLAPNPSPMTGPGTNTYIVGEGRVAVIDPGPRSTAHLDALQTALAGRQVSHIIVTHSHLDHSPLARPLSEATGAPVLAFGDTFAGRTPVMAALAAKGMAGGGEGLDHAFAPDVIVRDGTTVQGADWDLGVIHTPGHLGNHISLVWGDAVFVGDMVMGWSTSLVSPPDGDMTDFMSSCETLKRLDARVFYSGHGAPITSPSTRVEELMAHRHARTAAICDALRDRPMPVAQIVDHVYADLNPALKPAAGRNVFAHLVALVTDGQVAAKPDLSPDAVFTLQGP